LKPYDIPVTGTSVVVTLPHPYAGADHPCHYRVADVRDRQVTLHAEDRMAEPGPPAGVPCLVRSDLGGRRSSCEALVVASTRSVLIVDVASDPRQHPRYRRPCTVRLEVPDTDLGVVEGVLEDISAGGMRVHTPVLLPLDQRVFVSLVLADTPAIIAIGEVRGMHSGDRPHDLVARLQFTLIAPSHRARLTMLLDSQACVSLASSMGPLVRQWHGTGLGPFGVGLVMMNGEAPRVKRELLAVS